MNYLNLYPILLGAVAVVSVSSHLFLENAAQAQPIAQFASSSIEGQAPFEVSFANNSRNADEFRWDFGDGDITSTTSADEAVTHEFKKPGIHTVTLTAIKDGTPPLISTETLIVRVTSDRQSDVASDGIRDPLRQVGSITLSPKSETKPAIPAQGPVFASRSDLQAEQNDLGGNPAARSNPDSYRNDVNDPVSESDSKGQTQVSDAALADSSMLETSASEGTYTETEQPLTGLDAIRELLRQLMQKISLSRLLAQVSTALSMMQLLPLLLVVLGSLVIGTIGWRLLPARLCWTGLVVITFGLASSATMFTQL